jgi:hypothetical protein
MIGFTCENLAPDQAATVFPLLREAIPGLTLEAWLRHAKRLGNQGRAGKNGIMTVRREPRPLPCGLFIYHRADDLEHGAVLVAEHMVAIDLLDPEPVMQVLVHELEQLAERLGCGGIRTMVIGKDAPITQKLLAAGHASTGAAMFKPVANGAATPARRRVKPVC